MGTIVTTRRRPIGTAGFTLIELMIVVACIGILAAIALPAYQDAVARAQTSEGFELADSLRPRLSEYMLQTGTCPDGTTPGFEDVALTGGKYVASLGIGGNYPNCYVRSMFRDTQIAAGLAGKMLEIQVIFVVGNGSISWACTNPPAATNIDARLLPTACR